MKCNTFIVKEELSKQELGISFTESEKCESLNYIESCSALYTVQGLKREKKLTNQLSKLSNN